MDKVQQLKQELKEAKAFAERSKERFDNLFNSSFSIAEQNRKMKEALFAITKAKGIGEAKMLAQSTLKNISDGIENEN